MENVFNFVFLIRKYYNEWDIYYVGFMYFDLGDKKRYRIFKSDLDLVGLDLFI